MTGHPGCISSICTNGVGDVFVCETLPACFFKSDKSELCFATLATGGVKTIADMWPASLLELLLLRERGGQGGEGTGAAGELCVHPRPCSQRSEVKQGGEGDEEFQSDVQWRSASGRAQKESVAAVLRCYCSVVNK